jgi:hypothetical protein
MSLGLLPSLSASVEVKSLRGIHLKKLRWFFSDWIPCHSMMI